MRICSGASPSPFSGEEGRREREPNVLQEMDLTQNTTSIYTPPFPIPSPTTPFPIPFIPPFPTPQSPARIHHSPNLNKRKMVSQPQSQQPKDTPHACVLIRREARITKLPSLHASVSSLKNLKKKKNPRAGKRKKSGEEHVPLITTIIHIIPDRIVAAGQLRARVLADRTPRRLHRLLLGVVDVVARLRGRAALALERVQQPEPVPDLVHRRAPQVVARHRPARHAARVDVAAVVDVLVGRERRRGRDGVGGGRVEGQGGAGGRGGAGRGLAHRGRERAVPEQQGAHAARRRRRRAQVRLEVEVEGRVRAVPERRPHRFGVRVGGPAIFDRVGHREKAESDVGGGVGSVENGKLEGEGWSGFSQCV